VDRHHAGLDQLQPVVEGGDLLWAAGVVAALGDRRVRHFVGVVGARQAGADVEELPHAAVEHEVADRPREEAATRAGLVALPGIAEEERAEWGTVRSRSRRGGEPLSGFSAVRPE
jgi:hypothetical protein